MKRLFYTLGLLAVLAMTFATFLFAQDSKNKSDEVIQVDAVQQQTLMILELKYKNALQEAENSRLQYMLAIEQIRKDKNVPKDFTMQRDANGLIYFIKPTPTPSPPMEKKP